MMVYEIKQDASGDYYLWQVTVNNSPCGDKHRLVFTSGLLLDVKKKKMELESK